MIAPLCVVQLKFETVTSIAVGVACSELRLVRSDEMLSTRVCLHGMWIRRQPHVRPGAIAIASATPQYLYIIMLSAELVHMHRAERLRRANGLRC